MPKNEVLFTEAGRRHLQKLCEDVPLVPSSEGFRVDTLSTYGELISDEDALKILLEKHILSEVKHFAAVTQQA